MHDLVIYCCESLNPSLMSPTEPNPCILSYIWKVEWVKLDKDCFFEQEAFFPSIQTLFSD